MRSAITKRLWACCLVGRCLLLGIIPAAVSLSMASPRQCSRSTISSVSSSGSHSDGISTTRRCNSPFNSRIINHHHRYISILRSTATSHGESTAQSSASDATNGTPSSSSTAPTLHTPPNNISNTGSTAIILNMNARSVTPQLTSIASNIVGEDNVFVTRTVEDATLAARTVVRRCTSATASTADDGKEVVSSTTANDENGDETNNLSKYSLVIPVGGDGTLSGWINTMVDEILLFHKLEQEEQIDSETKKEDDDDEPSSSSSTRNNETSAEAAAAATANTLSVEDAVQQLPLVGYIPMGTGNGLGYVIGCKARSSSSSDDDEKTSILSKINVLAMMKRKKYKQFRRVLRRLKDVGDIVQEAERMELQQQLDITDAVSGKCSIVQMPLMEVTHPDDSNVVEEKGDLCFFAGAGFDSLMLHDFQQIKAWAKSSSTTRAIPSFIKDALSSVTGYCVALVTKTLPQTLRYGTHKIHVDVTTRDADTLWVDHRRGDFSELAVQQQQQQEPKTTRLHSSSRQNGEEFPDNKNNNNSGGRSNHNSATTATTNNQQQQQHLIYSGTTGIIAAATTPYYGGGMKLFPYARLIPDKLQLRLGRISPLTGFFNIPKIFEGSYREKSDRSFGCLDFIGKEFEVEVRSGRYEEYVMRQSEKERMRRRRRLPWLLQKWSESKLLQKSDDDDDDDDDADKKQRRRLVKKGFPFQHSGESMGIKERFRLRVVQEPVKFVSFLEPRVIVDD
ncbi:hypothetical protein ACHAXR_005933 [Thalassiosira sp. AJA248-18]